MKKLLLCILLFCVMIFGYILYLDSKYDMKNNQASYSTKQSIGNSVTNTNTKYINTNNTNNTNTKESKIMSEYELTTADISKMKSIISQKITSNMKTAEKIQAIHDWMILNTRYDTTYKQHNTHETLNSHIAVCSGYTSLFNAFMDLLDIPCESISGTATNSTGKPGNHAWNAVKINNYWYYIDVTWDDPTMNNISDYKDGYNLRYKYFLISKSTISKDHTSTKSLSPESPTDYNRDYYNNLELNTYKKQWAKARYYTSIIHSTDKFDKFLKKSKTNTNYAIIINRNEVDYNNVIKKIKKYAKKKHKSSKWHWETKGDIQIVTFYYYY